MFKLKVELVFLTSLLIFSIPIFGCSQGMTEEEIIKQTTESVTRQSEQAERQALEEETKLEREKEIYNTAAYEVTGTIEVTTLGARANEVGIYSVYVTISETPIALFHLDSPAVVSARSNDGQHPVSNREVTLMCLPDDYAQIQYDGQKAVLTATEWGYWPSDISGAMWDIRVEDSVSISLSR